MANQNLSQFTEKLFVADADIENAFYAISLPVGLRRFFGLQPVAALGLKEWGGRTVAPPPVELAQTGRPPDGLESCALLLPAHS